MYDFWLLDPMSPDCMPPHPLTRPDATSSRCTLCEREWLATGSVRSEVVEILSCGSLIKQFTSVGAILACAACETDCDDKILVRSRQALCNLFEKHGVRCQILRLAGNAFGNEAGAQGVTPLGRFPAQFAAASPCPLLAELGCPTFDSDSSQLERVWRIQANVSDMLKGPSPFPAVRVRSRAAARGCAAWPSSSTARARRRC